MHEYNYVLLTMHKNSDTRDSDRHYEMSYEKMADILKAGLRNAELEVESIVDFNHLPPKGTLN